VGLRPDGDDSLLIEERNVLLCDGRQAVERKAIMVLREVTIIGRCCIRSFMWILRNVPHVDCGGTAGNHVVALNVDSRSLIGSEDGFRGRQASVRTRADVQQKLSNTASFGQT